MILSCSINLLTPSFLREPVRIAKEFLEIASTGFIFKGFSDPSNFICKGLLGNTPAAIRGP